MYKNCLNFILQVLVFNTLTLSITLSNTICLICENYSQKGSCINFTTLGIYKLKQIRNATNKVIAN